VLRARHAGTTALAVDASGVAARLRASVIRRP